jgi:ABC-type branched-subunit amino acid transport system substrate-binding protein
MTTLLCGGTTRGEAAEESGSHQSACLVRTDASDSTKPAPARHETSRISRRVFLIWSVASAALIAGGRSVRAAEPSPTVKVGFIIPEHGDLASEAKSLLAGFDLFLKEKGAEAPSLQILKKDSGPDDAKILEAVTDLTINQEVTFLIGPPSLDGAEKTLRGVADAKAIVFVTNPAVRLVAGELCSPRIFSVRPNSYQAARPLAPWALKNVGLRVFITGDDDPLGNAEADFFAHGFEKSGGMFVDRVMVPVASGTVKTVLDAVAESKPDFVFASFRGQKAAAFLKAYRSATPRLNQPVIGPEALTAFPHTLTRVGKNCAGVRTLTTLKDPEKLVARIKEKLRQDVTDASRAAEGYDLAAIVCAVASRNPLETDPSKLVEVIQQMEIEGPRGKLSFDPNHEPILDVMVQEWVPGAKGYTQKIVENLGPCRSLDFGCGRVGFPRRQESEPKEELSDESRSNDIIWEDENQ